MFQMSLKAARVNAELSQKEASKTIGVDTSTLGNWERGKTSPKYEQLQKLCNLYSIPFDCIVIRRKSTKSEQIS